MSDDIVSRVQRIDARLKDAEDVLYGDGRTRAPGLAQDVRDLTRQLDRQILVVWGLIVVCVINIATVALAVLQ